MLKHARTHTPLKINWQLSAVCFLLYTHTRMYITVLFFHKRRLIQFSSYSSILDKILSFCSIILITGFFIFRKHKICGVSNLKNLYLSCLVDAVDYFCSNNNNTCFKGNLNTTFNYWCPLIKFDTDIRKNYYS